jgi:hypothetical protein
LDWVAYRILLSTIAVPTLWGGIFGGIKGRLGFDNRFIINWDIRKRQQVF